MKAYKFIAVALGLLIHLSACSGSGNDTAPGVTDGEPPTSDNPAETDPPQSTAFGLEQREALAGFNLPLDGSSLSSYKLVNVYPNLTFLEALLVDAVPGENRMVVVEQAGRIKVFDNDPAVISSKVILDFSAKVAFSGEQGLLGMAFDPDFTRNRFVYVYYTTENPDLSVISRMRWESGSDMLDPSSERIILQVEQPYRNHNAGMIEFGPDGYLYIALGDGGDGGDPHNNAQDRSTLLGSILRIDVHPDNSNNAYDIPLDNPFVNEQNVRPEIFAYGFRNPFRFSFDRQTGELWVGDVGQELIEEINVVKSGGNYGWRVFEGTTKKNDSIESLPDSAFIPPVFEYTHDEGLSVIGGYVYRGSRVSSLIGRYLFTDFYSGNVWALSWDGQQVTASDIIATMPEVTSFGEDHDGEVLLVARYKGIFKIEADTVGAEAPARLSETGLFTDLQSLTPISGLIEYQPGHPFWSDHAEKRRWIGIPDGNKVEFTTDDWTFPVGTVAVKHFEMNMIENTPSSAKRLETRILLHSLQGWQGYTYRWNAAGTEADLVSDRQSETLTIKLSDGGVRNQFYEYPNRTDCLQCHTSAEKFVLGLSTPQMNSEFDYAGIVDNQLRSWNNIALFNSNIGDVAQYRAFPALDDESASLDVRARAYLDVNCSSCHQPSGPAPTSLDFRATTPSSEMNAIGVRPQAGNIGISNPSIIAAGEKERSVLWERLRHPGLKRMPPLATHVINDQAVRVIGDWIDAM